MSLSGPLPPLKVSEVQTTVSPALKPPVPGVPQLQGVSGHTTEVKLPAAARVPVTPTEPVEVAVMVADSAVASGPSCDHETESFSLSAPKVTTFTTESVKALLVLNRIAANAATEINAKSLRIETGLDILSSPILVRRSAESDAGDHLSSLQISFEIRRGWRYQHHWQTVDWLDMKVPLSENQPLTPIDGLCRKNHE